MKIDKRKRVRVKDVQQIAYEVGLWAIGIERNRRIKKKLGMPAENTFKEKFDNWIEERIKLALEK